MSNFAGSVLALPRKGKPSPLLWGLLCLTLYIAPWPANAVEVYQWTDENGVVHFSQWAPTAPGKDVSTLEVDGSQPPGFDPEADLYNVEANQKSMESLWSDFEKQKEESRKQQAVPGPQIIQQTITPEYGIWPAYPSYGLRPPQRPDRPVKPEQPIEPPSTWVPRKRGG